MKMTFFFKDFCFFLFNLLLRSFFKLYYVRITISVCRLNDEIIEPCMVGREARNSHTYVCGEIAVLFRCADGREL